MELADVVCFEWSFSFFWRGVGWLGLLFGCRRFDGWNASLLESRICLEFESPALRLPSTPNFGGLSRWP